MKTRITQTSKAILLAGMLCTAAAHAEIYIINSQTLDPEQLGTGGGHSLSDVAANRKVLLDYYQYTHQQTAVAGHQQSTQELTYKIQQLSQTGADEQTLTSINSQITQLQDAIQTTLPALSKFEMPEFQQLHRTEQENARQLENLQQQAAKIPVIQSLAHPPADKQ